MNVEQVMTTDVMTCRPGDNLNSAARIMWEHDCGCVPVVDDNERVVGMITDRDICMAAYTQGRPLQALGVAGAMSRSVCCCKPADRLETAEELMRTHQVRRLPVMDDQGRLVGILSLGDLARQAKPGGARKGKSAVGVADIGQVLNTISQPHPAKASAA